MKIFVNETIFRDLAGKHLHLFSQSNIVMYFPHATEGLHPTSILNHFVFTRIFSHFDNDTGNFCDWYKSVIVDHVLNLGRFSFVC